MKAYKVQIYFYRTRGSWSEYYLVLAESVDEAKDKCKDLTNNGDGSIMDYVEVVDMSKPYLILDTSD